ncbi:glycoside hydrolase superfamily [Aspergillus pseudodeflectus]|uniref:Glycoside hydrolase superfamily n=1 Tax=Aspergillus pseudodeflectus TaxID=176178 RepID=A0ABR4KIC5_9EURO
MWTATLFVVLLLSVFAEAYPVGKITTPTKSTEERPEAHYLQDAPLTFEHGAIAAAPEPLIIEVTVWVDNNGQPLSTETHFPTKTVARVSTEALEHMPNRTHAAVQEPTSLPPFLAVPDLAAPHGLVPTLGANVKTDHNPNSHMPTHPLPQQNTKFFGISYSPYNADSTCKNQAQVDQDIARLTHYAFVRIYGVDCDQARKVVNAAKSHNMKVFAGVYDLQNLHASLKTIIDAAAPDLSILHTISIGNELLNRGQNSAGDVVNAVHDARAYLHSLGYTGPVVTIDTFSKLLEHPELCHVSDYCAANCHAFFDNNQTPENAGDYVRDIAHRLSSISGGKRTIITESGWPHAGQANGRAVPSLENQRKAIESLRRSFSRNPADLVLFSAFDDMWKEDNQWTFGAEKFWGFERP